MRGRTPLADDTPKRAPLTPPRETAPVNITCGRGSCTEGKIVPYFSSPTAPTRTITSTSSVDEHLINQSQQNYPVNHRQQQQEVAGAYYRTKQTAQDKRSRLSNVINSLYRKVPVNDRNSVEKNLETLEKYVMTVLNGVIKDAETEGTADKHRKSNDSCYNGPNVESRIITDDGKPLNELSSEPTAVEPAVPNVTISQNSASENKEEEQIQSVEIGCKLKESTALVVDAVETVPSSLNNDEITAKLKNEPTKCENIETICRDLLNELVSEISQAIDVEPVNTSLQCSLPLEKVAPVLDYCETSPNLCKSTVRHLCLYCDRKFLSISLRQRHTERVHQLGGGRRSARNTRKTNCQYCSEKYAENLDELFQHMIDSHSDKYHGCLQCSTRYSTREALLSHTNVLHPKEEKDTPEFKTTEQVKKVKRSQRMKMFTPIKLNILPRSTSDLREPSTSQDFDSSFYSNVSCNIRENLLHHLDGKLYHNNSSNSMIVQPCQQQTFHEPVTQIQFPIDISLTAATPGYNHKEYSITDESENSSEYAEKPGKISSSHPRRISFEKYNFPKKYDGKEQWNCSIRDLCEFDITAQLTMRKKQDLSNEKLPLVETKHATTTVVSNTELIKGTSEINSENPSNVATENKRVNFGTQFTVEFGNFIRLRRWDECPPETPKNEEIVYAELTGEWSRPRVYICGACFSKHRSLKDVEDHKLVSHPNVWCSHLEFSGDQTELDKHLVLLGRGAATMNAKNAILHEKICTKCSKICATLSELHKHMLECGGDQTWLLGLFGNGKKKCKWRPFGSRRRRQRGMKRNIQNSQNSQNQVNRTPKEKQPSTPRVRPSDRESIEKMLANLPAKRSTRRARQEINLRSQARLSKIQTRSKQRKTENISNSRLSRKAVLCNKLIKNSKSFQRKRCRGDNISAAIESVITNYDINIKKHNVNDNMKEDSGIKNSQSIHRPGKILKDMRVARNRKNLKIQDITSNNIKSLKNRKNSTIKLTASASKITKSNVHNTKSRRTEILPTIKRKKSSESVISSASIKAKSQLRTNDGKFARNSIKHDENLSDNQSTNLHSSSQSSDAQFTRSNVTRSATRSQQQENLNVTLSRRVTRVSCDVDKMPTLELADKLTSHQVEPGKLSNELPILSPVLKVPPTASSELDKSSIIETIPKKRGRKKRMVQNNKKTSQNTIVNPPESSKNVKIIHTQTRKSYQCQKLENEKANVSDPSPSIDECDSSNNNAKSEEKSTSTAKKSKPQIRRRMAKTQPNKQQSSESLIEKLPESVETREKNISNLQVKSSTKKQTAKQSKKKIVRTASSAVGTKIMRGKRQLLRQRGRTDKNIEQDTSVTRKSPRTLSKKSLSNSFFPTSLSTTLPKNLIDTPVETKESVNEEKDKKEENIELIDAETIVKEHVKETEKVKDTPESIKELPGAVAKENDETETLDAKIAIPIDKEQEINQHEDENSPVIEKQSSPIEIVCDLVNLSFEHLQQESSNSNIDSGKENSSETPINITKSKVPRPKKSRGFRRDRGPGKRTLNNVIGILTEGVNIPIEVQQSLVLTVQTSIESLNAQSHSSNTQNEGNRVELEYNNVASGATNSVTSNPDESATENVIVDSAVNYEHGDTDSQKVTTIKETADPETTVPQMNSQSTELLPPANDTINNAQTVANTNENFSTDIILDLSRRKQNGKGSFLEKIVSKIAKQKDVLLDNEVGSLLDHAVDELSIILDDVGPKMPFDTENKAQSRINQKNDNEPSNSESLVMADEDVTSINKKLLNENEIERIEEHNKISDAGEHNPATLSSDVVDKQLKLQTINSEESRELERVSKKRAADITLPITNKRKTINEEEKIEAKIDDELYLSDIMKLINSTPKVAQSPVMCSNTDQEEIRMGKRKIAKGKEDDSTENLSKEMIEFDCYTTTTSKKLRKNQRDLVRAEKKSNVSSRGRRSSNRRNTYISDSVNPVIESKESEIDENDEKIGDENLIDIEKSEKSSETFTNSHKLKIEASEAASCSGNLDNSKEAPIPEPSTEEIENGKDLVNEISPGTIVVSQEHETLSKKSWIDEELPSSKATRKSKEIVTSKENENSETVDSSKLNCYTSNQLIGLEKPNEMTISVNSCTDPQNLQVPVTSLSDIAIEDKSTTPKDQKCSKRKNNRNRKVDTPNVEGASIERQNNTLVQRRQTLKRKAKENIFLIEELLDFGDDIDIPLEITKKEESKKDEDKLIGETVLQPIKELLQTGMITTQVQSEPKDEEKKIIEDLPKVNSEIIEETHTGIPINKVEPIAGEPSIDDDTLNLKKRASGNFAVVHTKSGEILIVEKKKKFTKEAARFFCDVCATSFTRKSSLKKHNISQSHILQVSKFSNEQESATLTETVPLEFPNLTNPLLPPENNLNGKVSEEKANEKEEKKEEEEKEIPLVSADSKIDTLETPATHTGTDPFNSQLEEELLDEEICKITENMTHDEYVLTDHISPEGGLDIPTPEKAVNVIPKVLEGIEAKEYKINLADEHLELESPPVPTKSKDESQTITLCPENVIPSVPKVYSASSPNLNISLDFSNIAEKLNGNKPFLQNERSDTTTIELNKDKNVQAKQDDITKEEKIVSFIPKEDQIDFKSSRLSKKSCKSTDSEKSMKKPKSHNKRSKKKCQTESRESESEVESDRENVKSRNKNKIVKSVFGRAFAGEKLDKVMEVLDDWNSKSENESQDEPFLNSFQPLSKEEKIDRKGRVNKLDESNSLSLESNSRCRQSKKRAEERISRTFEEDSIPYELKFETLEKKGISHDKASSYDKELHLDNLESAVESKRESNSQKSQESYYIPERKKEENSSLIDNFSDNSKLKIIIAEEPSLADTNSMESIHTRVPSCPRERSSTPDLISVTTRDSDNEAEEFATDINDEDDEDEEQLSVRGRLSPFYASNAPESSINSGTMSTSNHINNTEDFMESRRVSTTEFSGEKIVIRSPVLSSQESCPGVVTIAPTDAIEDNALDVPQEIHEMKEKPEISRQGKVLNFDEELFVECCSRLKATTENELRGAKKIKLNQTDDYETTEQSCQGVRPISDHWRDVESQNSLGSLLESVNQLLGEEMYNSRRTEESHKRRNEVRETVSPIRIVQNDSIRPDNVSYEDSLDVAFEHNNKLRDKIQQRMRESENMIAASFGQNMTNNGKNYKNYYDTRHEENPITEKIESEGDTFNTSVNYSSKHIPLEPLGVNNKINPTMDGFLDKALSNLLHQNGKHDHNGSTPMKVLAELACAQVPASTTKSDTKTAFEKLSSNSHKTEKEVPKKCRNPIKELFERKKELNDRKKEPINTVKQKSKKIKHQDESPLIRKSQFGVGLVERKKRHINYEKKVEKPPVIRIKDVYEFDDEDSPIETKFTSPKTSYRSHSEKLTESATKHSISKESREINVCELMSRTITKTLDNGKTTESSGKRLNTMIERKLQESEAFIPKTKGALKSYHIEEKQQRGKHVTGPMDNFVERKRTHRKKRLSETSGKTLKTKKKNKNSKKRSRHAWYEDDSLDEFVTAFKADSVGVGITKSQRTCSKGKQNLFAELSSTTSESEYEELRNDKEENKDSKIKEWIDEVAAETKNVMDDCEKIESNHPLVIDEKESERPENSDDDDDDDRSGQAFELDDLYREDSSDAISDFEAEKESPEIDFQRADDKDSGKNDLIPLDEALVLFDNPENAEKEESLEKIQENRKDDKEIPPTVHSNVEDLPEKLSSDEKPPKKAPDNLPLHVFLSRKVQESKKKKEEKLKKLKEEKEREKKKKQEELEAVEENDQKDNEQTIEYHSTRRQRKCAIGKQGLLAESSSSDEEYYYRDMDRRSPDKSDYEKSRRQKRESKEKRKERDIEKKHELIIAKEQKAIEEEILRQLKMKKPNETKKKESDENLECINRSSSSSKSNKKQKSKNLVNEAKVGDKNEKKLTNSDTEIKCNKLDKKTSADNSKRKEERSLSSKKNDKKVVQSTPEINKSTRKIKKSGNHKKTNSVNGESSNSRNSKDRKSTSAKRDTDDDDEELKTTKSWNRVDEGVGVAIGRRKRAAANQLYYWSSSTDEDEELVQVTPVVEEEDDRQEQHGWIVGDSHKKMITMLAMEKQLKEKRRRSEDEFESGKTKNKKYRNSTS